MNKQDSWFDTVPKVELHVHLEGAIPFHALWELVKKYGRDDSVTSVEDIKERFVFRDFSQFIDTWVWKNQYLREYEDFEFISEAVARDMAHQNIRYAEIFYSPPDFHKHGLETQLLTQAIHKGLKKCSDICIRLIPDLVRDFGPKKAQHTLEEINEVKDLGIIGVGLGGSENKFPAKPFTKVFKAAVDFGLKTSVHAGEASGPESIWEAVRYLYPNRIGHGTRAIEDPELMTHLRSHQVPVDVCPISNIRTGVVSDIYSHPVRDFFDFGLLISINTDDPMMFGNSLAEEYNLLVGELGFSIDDIRSVILSGIQASWMDEQEKVAMVKMIKDDPNW